jgi:hypothetical protein
MQEANWMDSAFALFGWPADSVNQNATGVYNKQNLGNSCKCPYLPHNLKGRNSFNYEL